MILVLTLQHSSELGRLEERTRTLAEEVALLRLELERRPRAQQPQETPATGRRVTPRRRRRLEIFIPFWGDPACSMTRWTASAPRGSALDAIVVDDCYPDPSVAETLRARRPTRASATCATPRTSGIAGNFQHCLDLASGDLVMFMGCDDLLQPDFARRMPRRARRFRTPPSSSPASGSSTPTVDRHCRSATGSSDG